MPRLELLAELALKLLVSNGFPVLVRGVPWRSAFRKCVLLSWLLHPLEGGKHLVRVVIAFPGFDLRSLSDDRNQIGMEVLF